MSEVRPLGNDWNQPILLKKTEEEILGGLQVPPLDGHQKSMDIPLSDVHDPVDPQIPHQHYLPIPLFPLTEGEWTISQPGSLKWRSVVTTPQKKPSISVRQPKKKAELNYPCHLCSRLFATPGFVVLHLKTHNEVDEPFLCTICYETFKESNELKTHLLTIHPEDYKVLNKTAHWSHRYKKVRKRPGQPEVMAIQVKHLKIQCTKCPERFANQSNLSQHTVTCHQTERPYVCTVCGNAYKCGYHLQDHKMKKNCESVLKKKAARIYNCDHCDLSFKAQSYLRRHCQRVHAVTRSLLLV